MRMSATTDVAIKTTCVADAILAMVAVLAMEDAGRAAGRCRVATDSAFHRGAVTLLPTH